MELGPLATTPTNPFRVPSMINVFAEQVIHALGSGELEVGIIFMGILRHRSGTLLMTFWRATFERPGLDTEALFLSCSPALSTFHNLKMCSNVNCNEGIGANQANSCLNTLGFREIYGPRISAIASEQDGDVFLGEGVEIHCATRQISEVKSKPIGG